MQISELRIGNFVIYENEILPICSLHSDSTLRLLKEGKSVGCYDIDEVQPLVLSREVLKKFGFTQPWTQDVWHKDGMTTWRLEYDEKEKAAGFRTDVYKELGHGIYVPHRLEYAHQLQNFYFSFFEEELIFTP